MIFGVLNPEKIWHQQLVQLPTSPVHCNHFTLGNPKKSFFNSIIHSYFRLVTLSQKNKLLILYPLHLKNVAPLPCKNCTNSSSFSFVHVYRVPIRYTDELWNSSVLLRHGLNFSRAWWMIQLISGKKDWKHVSVQKVVTLNICCNVACLTFHLPHTTTSSSQSHQCQPTNGSLQIHQRLEKRTYLQSDENVVHFTR